MDREHGDVCESMSGIEQRCTSESIQHFESLHAPLMSGHSIAQFSNLCTAHELNKVMTEYWIDLVTHDVLSHGFPTALRVCSIMSRRMSTLFLFKDDVELSPLFEVPRDFNNDE